MREIKTLMPANLEKVEARSRLVNGTGATMSEIAESSQRVTTIVSESTQATDGQAAAAARPPASSVWPKFGPDWIKVSGQSPRNTHQQGHLRAQTPCQGACDAAQYLARHLRVHPETHS